MTEFIVNDGEWNKMASVFGNMGPFDESSEQWSSYTEQFEYFVVGLHDYDKNHNCRLFP